MSRVAPENPYTSTDWYSHYSDIHAELNEYKKEFIYLRDFLDDVFKVVDADISDVITWILKKIKQAGITLYTVNEFNEVEPYIKPYENRSDLDVLYAKLDTVRKCGCFPCERDESGFLVSGYW